MVDKTLLEDMSCISVNDIPPTLLKDIEKVEIRGETASQRLENYMEQVGNPYCFRVGKTSVKISFKSCEETIDKKIKAYFLGLKT